MTQFASRHSRLLLLACALVWLAGSSLAGGSLAWACPNCGDAMASDPAQAGLVRGIFWSILFLMSMPFLIFASLGGYFYWLIHRAQPSAPASAIEDVADDVPFITDTSVPVEQLETVEV